MDNRQNPYIASLLGVCTVALLALSLYLFFQNQQLENLKQAITTKDVNADPKFLSVPFDPKKGYVTSTAVFQQLAGKIVAYDTSTYIITLEKDGERIDINLPFGLNARYNPPGFADVKGMREFKVGDEVEIGGQSGPTAEFEITRFVIVSQSNTP